MASVKALIEQEPGGFDAMNNYVQEKICEALQAGLATYVKASGQQNTTVAFVTGSVRF